MLLKAKFVQALFDLRLNLRSVQGHPPPSYTLTGRERINTLAPLKRMCFPWTSTLWSSRTKHTPPDQFHSVLESTSLYQSNPSPKSKPTYQSKLPLQSTPPIESTPLPKPTEVASAAQSKWALLIGIDNYPKLPEKNQLRGCVRDTVGIERILCSRFGFLPGNIQSIRNEKATRDEILKAFDGLVRRVQKDDIVVVQYSGHGSRQRDPSKGSGWSETIVPHDCGCLATGHPRTDITDVEIRAHLLEPLATKTGHITLLFDSCRSGSISRDDFGQAVRGIDPDDEDDGNSRGDNNAQVDDIRSGWFPINERYVLLAACQAHQYASEQIFGGEHQGAFTFRLIEQIERGNTDQLQSLFQQASARVTADFPSQQPLMEGARNAALFGTERLEMLHFLPVKSVSGSRVRIDGGFAQGVTIGSTWSVRPPTSTSPTATLQIDAVFSFESDARMIGEGTVQSEDWCFELSHNYGEASLNACVSPRELLQQHPELEKLLQQRELSGVLNLLPEDESTTADVKLVYLETAVTDGDPVPQPGQIARGRWAAFGLDGHFLFPPSEDLGVFCENLRKLARYRFGLGIRNVDHTNSLRGQLSIQLLRRNKGQTWIPAQPETGGLPVFQMGERISCNISNHSAKTVYIYLLEFGEDGSVTQMYPAPGGEESLGPGASANNVITGTLQASADYLAWLIDDERPTKGFTEVYKVFAATQPLNLSQFMQSRYHVRDHRVTLLEETADGMEWETTTASFIMIKPTESEEI